MELLKLGTMATFRVDAPLPFNVRDDSGKLLLAQGRTISAPQLAVLLARGVYVDREEYKAAAAATARAASCPSGEQPRVQLTVFDLWEQSVGKLDRLLRGMGNEPDFAAHMHAFAAQFVALVDRDADVAIYVSMRQDERRMARYGLMHALHTALGCRLAASGLGWPQERQLTLVKAALTMNVAMLELQGRLAMQDGRLTDEQREQVRAHPEQGCAMLRAAGVSDEDWLLTVQDHHERAGGGGYPRGTAEVSELSAALRLADVFMAKISPRAVRPALSIQDAAKQMFQESQGSPFAASMIKGYGVYPPGDFVQLASGETAVVTRRGATAHTPLVAAITDRSGIPTLGTTRRDTAQAAFKIVASAGHKKFTLPVSAERLFGLTR